MIETIEQFVEFDQYSDLTKKEFVEQHKEKPYFPILTRIWDGKEYDTTIWKLDTFDNFVADWI